MADSDSEPLLDDLGGANDAPTHPNVDFSRMVFFYGKEMKTTPYSGIFRIGVSKEGVFKLDNEENKVFAHWKYSDITDWTYSGYSFSLTTQGNKHHYIRTDDGDALCKYIEAFIKNPEDAMEMATLNPPMSKFPDSAVKSLSKKFSSAGNQDLGSSPPNDGMKFYTLTRKPPQRTHLDGVPRSVQHMHVDVDSRLNLSPRELQRRSLVDPQLRGGGGGGGGSSSKNRDPLDPVQLHPLLTLPSPFREKSLSISEGNPRFSNGFSSHEGEVQSRFSETPRPRSNILPTSSYSLQGGVTSGSGEGGGGKPQPPQTAAHTVVESPDLINLTSPPPTNATEGQQERGESQFALLTNTSTPTPAASVGGGVRTKAEGSKSAANMLWSRRKSEGKEAVALQDAQASMPITATATTTSATDNTTKKSDPMFQLKSSTLPLPVVKHDPSPLGQDINECSSCSDSEHGSPFRRSAPPGGTSGGGGGGEGGTADLLHIATTKYAMSRISCESEETNYDKLLGISMVSPTHITTTLTTPLEGDQTSSSSSSEAGGVAGNPHLLLPASERESLLHHQHTQHQHSSRRPNVYEEITMPLVVSRKEASLVGGRGGQHAGSTKVGAGGSFFSSRSRSPSDDDDDNYDHLPGSRGESPTLHTTTPPYSYGLSMGDRCISQPILRGSRLPLSPQTSGAGKPTGVPESLDEESAIGESDDRGGLNSASNPLEQRPLLRDVVLRSKPKPPAPITVSSSTPTSSKGEDELDPFEELMTRPSAASRLRWSQELNPLYDYFKGAKFTQKMASLDYVLYENPQEEHTTTPSSTTTSTVTSPLVQTEGGEEGEPSPIPREEAAVGSDNLPEEERGGDEVSLITDQPMIDLETAGEMAGMALSSSSETTPSSTLPRPRRSHMYEDVPVTGGGTRGDGRPRSYVSGIRHQSDVVTSSSSSSLEKVDPVTLRHPDAAPLVGAGVVAVGGEGTGAAPIANLHIGKRQIMLNQRRSRTIGSLDDLAVTKRKQKPLKAADNMKDFSYVMREFRVFYIQMPNGNLLSDAINITRPVSEVIEKLCYYLGVDDSEVYVLYLTGSCLTSLKETGVDAGDAAAIHFKVNRKGSFIHLVDHQALPDQGNDPILLKNNLSLKMQGITTSRILLLEREQDIIEWPVLNIVLSPEDEFNKCWLSIVQGNTPCSMEQAVRLAAIQYQAYVQHRTAMNSTVAFCRPIDFLPVEYAGIRGIDQKMYKEQESLNLRSEKDIYMTYRTCYNSLPTHDTVFFPAREPRRKLLHSTKLKPILIGVNSKGVLRVDHRTKEVLDMWEYQVLKNWAYSKRTFVLAFANKNYPMESIQARWISTLVDFHVDSILDSAANLGKLISDADNNP